MQNITPKRTRNNRTIIREEYKVFNGKTAPDGEEYGSAGLASAIQTIVNACDRHATVGIITAKFYPASNKTPVVIEIPILPTIVEMNKGDDRFIQIYVNCEDQTDTILKTKEATKTKEGKAAFKEAAADNANKAILYVQRELCIKYLELKAQSSKTPDELELLKFLESLSLVRTLDLGNIKKANIGFKKIKGLDYREADSKTADYECVRDYSAAFQAAHAGTNDIEIVSVSENHPVIGLQKGTTPEEIAYFAELDALANQVKFDKEVYDKGIVSNYTTQRKIAKPQPGDQ